VKKRTELIRRINRVDGGENQDSGRGPINWQRDQDGGRTPINWQERTKTAAEALSTGRKFRKAA